MVDCNSALKLSLSTQILVRMFHSHGGYGLSAF